MSRTAEANWPNGPFRNNQTDQLVATWRARLPLGKPEPVRSGFRLFSQGDTPRWFFLLASGLAKLTCSVPDGREVVVQLCQPGRFVDTISPMLNGTYANSATTLTDCTVFRRETAAILDTLGRDREATRLLVQAQAAELRQVHRSVVDQRTLTAQQRFEQLLWNLSALLADGKPSGPFRLPPSVTETQMAGLISVSIGQLSRMKRKLQLAGLIDHGGRGIVVLEAAALFHGGTP